MGFDEDVTFTEEMTFGEMELDNTLTSRDIINAKIRGILDEATDPGASRLTELNSKTSFLPRKFRMPWKSR